MEMAPEAIGLDDDPAGQGGEPRIVGYERFHLGESHRVYLTGLLSGL